MDFQNIFGNLKVKERMSNALRSRTLSHAFILSGPEGSGKHTLAYSLAAALNCERREMGHIPCMQCNTCRRVFDGSFVDLKVLSLDGGKVSIGVDEVRLMREDMFLSATESDYKVYLFEDADKLTVQAQNALLKVLEEPIAGVLILLLCERADRLLTTIRSRAPQINMEYFSPEQIDNYLMKNSPLAQQTKARDAVGYQNVLIRADGSIGRALRLLEGVEMQNLHTQYEEVCALVRCCSVRVPYSKMLEESSSIPTKRAEFIPFMEEVLRALRDLIAIKKCEEITPLFFPSKAECEDVADGFTTSRLMLIYDLILDCIEQATQNANMTVVISLFVAKLKHNC